MGYGTRALYLLSQYYEGRTINLSEMVDTEDNIPTVSDSVCI